MDEPTIPTMSGRVAVVTGASSGIGLEAVRGLARLGATVVLCCRDAGRGEAARAAIARAPAAGPVSLELADLASLAQVRALADRLLARFPAIHLLVNDAGVYRSGLEHTPDGAEMTMGVNHLAPFVLTARLQPALTAGRARIINVSSEAHRGANLRRAPLDRILRGDGHYNGFRAYADSKLANILFTRELARRDAVPGATVLAFHPGMVATHIWNQNQDAASRIIRLFKPLMLSPARSGGFLVRLATRPLEQGSSGRYFRQDRPGRPSADALDEELGRALWDASGRVMKNE